MTLPLAVFLVSVLHVDLFVHEELIMHGFDCFVRSFKRIVGYETEALRYSLVVAGDLRKIISTLIHNLL